MEDNLWWKTPFDGRRSSMEDDNEDNLKNKGDLHIAGRHTALDIFRFAVFFFYGFPKPFMPQPLDLEGILADA